MYQINQYFKFILKSTNEHGVHSPFVYDLITKCSYDKSKYNDYKKMVDSIDVIENADQILEVKAYLKKNRINCFKYNYSLESIVQNFSSF